MNPTAYPLSWPPHQERTPSHQVEDWPGQPKPTLTGAYSDVENEVRRMGAILVAISTDVPIGKRTGKPLSDQEYRAESRGAAAWFTRRGTLHVIACDRFRTPSQNLRAIALIIEGRRREERYGSAAMVQAAWSTFQADALPQRATVVAPPEPWWDVLQVAQNAPIDVIEAAYRAFALKNHPDVPGGSAAAMSRINDAISAARAAKGVSK